MIVQQLGDLPTGEEHAGLYVLLHRVTGQVGAGDEAHVAVGDRDFGVNSPVSELGRPLTPSVELRGGNQFPHLADHVERHAAAVILRRFEQHRDAHAARAGVVQRLHDGRDVVGHEAGDEQGLLRRADDLQ